MSATYRIEHTGGAHLRAGHRTATSDDVRDTLIAAARYVGCHAPTIVNVDGGDVYVYDSAAAAASDRDGQGERPILVAREDV